MAKRVLIFSLNYYPFVGGAEVAIKEITDRISPEDIEFHLIAYKFDSALPKVERIGNVVVHRIGIGRRGTTVGQTFHPLAYAGKVLYVPLAALAAWRLTRREAIDAYWAMMSYMLFPIVLLRIFGIRRPYVLTLQEGDPFEHVFERRRIRAVAPLLRSGFRHATNVQAISTFLLTWAKQAGFSGEGTVIPNGVDTERFAHDYSAADIAAAREHLGAKGGEILLVTTSRLVRKNGIDTVIRALALMPQQVFFFIYGSGPDEEKLRALAAELGVSGRARFMGQASHEDLPLILAACDIFVRPSRSEGMGNSFIEAMAAGVPVIATQEGGISDFLFDTKRNVGVPPTGWAVDPDAPEQIARTADDILTHSSVTKELVTRARRMALENYDWRTIAAKMNELFNTTCATVARPRPRASGVVFAAGPLSERGGPAQYVYEIARELTERSYQVSIVHFHLLRTRIPGLRHFLYFFRLIPAALRSRVIIAVDTWSVAMPALVAAKLTGSKLAIRIGGDFLWEHYIQRTGADIKLSQFYSSDVRLSFKERFIYGGTRYLLAHANAIAFNTEWQRNIWQSAYELPEHTYVVENRYPPHQTQGNRLKTFVCAGRHSKVKNLKRVKDAFAQAREKHPEFVLDLRTLPEKEHEERLRSCYALIQGSISDISPNAVIQAAAFGTPFVCTNDTGIQDKLDGRGLFVDTLKLEELVQAIERLMDPGTYRQLSSVSGMWPERDWEQVTNDYESILERI